MYRIKKNIIIDTSDILHENHINNRGNYGYHAPLFSNKRLDFATSANKDRDRLME